MVGLQLVVELLKGCEVKATNRDSTVTLLLTDSLEVIDRMLTSPATDELLITLSTHVDVLMFSPVATGLLLGLLHRSFFQGFLFLQLFLLHLNLKSCTLCLLRFEFGL